MNRSFGCPIGIIIAVVLLSLGRSLSAAERPLLLAHYMPWFTVERSDDGSPTRYGWHWTMNHFDPSQRDDDGQPQIASHFHPLIGPYDSGDEYVLEYHLLTMRAAGIDGVIVDWYGLSDLRDYAALHRNTTLMLQQCERLGMKFVICYEDQTVPALVEAGRLDEAKRVDHVVEELTWLSKYWFRSGAYVKQAGQPVLLSFGFGGLKNDEWGQVIERLEFPVQYFSQNIRRAGAVGGFDWPAPQQGPQHVDAFIKRAGEWEAAIPVVYPRFVDIYQQAGVNDGYGLIEDRNGRTFRSTLARATKVNPPIIQIATWNDWGEGTQIEPSAEFGYRDLKAVQKWRAETIRTFDADEELLDLPLRLYQLRRQWSAETGEAASELDAIRDAILARNEHLTTIRLNRLEDRPVGKNGPVD